MQWTVIELSSGILKLVEIPAILHTWERQRPKDSIVHLLLELIMFPAFTSSAIENISDVENGQVTITFNGGRDYTYGVADVERFVTEMTNTITQGDSVGRYVNNALRSDLLTLV